MSKSEKGTENMKNIKTQKVEEYLKCDFTETEIKDFADDLSRKIGELELKKLSKKDVVKSIDAEIATIEASISSLATRVKDKYEYRMVKVEINYDYDKKEKSYVRIDIDEEYKNLPMQDHELQTDFLESK